MLAWSKGSSGSPVLAIGTVKGNLQLYYTREQRRTPIVGKHTKRVCCGVWSGSLLAMAAFDKTVISGQRLLAATKRLCQDVHARRQAAAITSAGCACDAPAAGSGTVAVTTTTLYAV
eukprot:GHRQ01028963.1.p1 GENE.GHRQ01028963.1~~GHRQ01028963.1.p1  ORF type:complete len:117 (-),score=24.27 GHRQ01028963.1:372-722(-)